MSILDGKTKRCPTCKSVLCSTRFHKANTRRDGLASQCKSCSAPYGAKSSYKNVLKRIGMTPEKAALLSESQNGVCAICAEPQRGVARRSGKKLPLCVDHNHQTGQIRGMLCTNCNRGMGLLRDNAQILEAAVAYLRAAESKADSLDS